MLNRFLSLKSLRREKSNRVVLIHGLFSNNAFWVPYLRYFEDCHVTLLNIDYAGFLNSGESFNALCADVDKLIEAPAAHLIGHSFGACLGAGLQTEFLSRSFICPTFASVAFDLPLFCSEIAGRTSADIEQIRPVVTAALLHKLRCAENLRYRSSDGLYVSRDDPFFQYLESAHGVSIREFRGGHFNVAEALAMIVQKRLPFM